MPNSDPGLANYLRQMGVLRDYPAIDPVPPLVRSQLPPACEICRTTIQAWRIISANWTGPSAPTAR